MDPLTISAVQIESAIGDCPTNARKHGKWIESAGKAGASLVFFPECSLTGYDMALAADIAIGPDDPCIAAVEEEARNANIAVGYGFIERDPSGTELYATYAVTSRQGRLVYRKTHLGTRERGVLSRGDALPVVAVENACVGVQLCWEAHIPDITGVLRGKGAQLVLMPHAGGLGGARRLESWARYLPARALDNGLYVAACNALRRTADGGKRGGGIAVYGPDGVALSQYDGADEHMLTVPIGGPLPRETPDDDMRSISYYDRRRPDLYQLD